MDPVSQSPKMLPLIYKRVTSFFKVLVIPGGCVRVNLLRHLRQVQQHLQPGGLPAVQAFRHYDPQSAELFGHQNGLKL